GLDTGIESGDISSAGQNSNDRFLLGMVFHIATSLKSLIIIFECKNSTAISGTFQTRQSA
ncbi:MAG: hypothetical protein J7M20_09015, partial [Deltaproteobacteria bacterium]|nr:hypothetical protein [Deltaproteobacteria bacterium]